MKNENNFESDINKFRKISIVSINDYGHISEENALSYFELYLSFCELFRLKMHIEEKYILILIFRILSCIFECSDTCPFKQCF